MTFQDFRLTATVLGAELRSAVRDRHVVIYSLVLPIFLYPALFWLLGQGIQYRSGALERQTSRVAWEGEELLPEFFEAVRSDPLVEEAPAGGAPEDVASGALDAYLRVLPAEAGPARLEAHYDLSSDRSVTTRRRIRDRWEEHSRAVLRDGVRAYGGTEAALEVLDVREQNVASPETMGRFLLSLLLPMILVIMLAMGAMYPAIDVLVGEKERRTMETLLAAGVPRASLVAGKFLSVLAASLAALLANLASMLLTLKHQVSLFGGEEDLSIGIPWSAIPVILVGGLLVGAFFSASMILVASSARTFKEGQGYLTPFYLLCMLPAVVGSSPGIQLGPLTALVPLLNATLVFRSALVGRFEPVLMALALVSLFAYLLLVLHLASRILGREALFLGDGRGGGFRRMLIDALARR